MISRLEIVGSCLLPDEDIKFDSDIEMNHIPLVNDSSTMKDSAVGEPTGASGKMNDKDNETEFYGFGEEERVKAKEQRECIVIESDLDDDASTDTSPADLQSVAQPPTEDCKGLEQEEELDGLMGRELYICGNIGCDETTETAVALKVQIFLSIYCLKKSESC